MGKIQATEGVSVTDCVLYCLAGLQQVVLAVKIPTANGGFEIAALSEYLYREDDAPGCSVVIAVEVDASHR